MAKRKSKRAARRSRRRAQQAESIAAGPDIESEPADADDHPPGAAAAEPVRYSKQARGERLRRQRRRGRLVRRTRAAVIGIGIGVPVFLLLAFTGGFFERHLGVEAASEGSRTHIADGSVLRQRNRPPSSGPHYSSPARYSVSSRPVPAGNWIHSLEHGGVAILYRCEDDDACRSLASRIDSEVGAFARPGAFGEVKIVGSPYQDMDSPITAVAWRRTLPLETFDAEQLLAFYDRYVDRGPERAR